MNDEIENDDVIDDNPFEWDSPLHDEGMVGRTPIMDETIEDLIEEQAEAEEEVFTIDWDIVDDHRVQEILYQAAARIAAKFAGITTTDDLYQEGAIWLASNHDYVRTTLADELLGARALHRRLHDRLYNSVRVAGAQSSRSIPHHVYAERAAEDGE